MKHLIFVTIITFFQMRPCAQTIIAPFIGYDFTKLESVDLSPDFLPFKILNNGYEIKSPLIGLKLEQYIFDRISLSYNFGYTRKNVEALIWGIAPYEGFTYEYYSNRVSVNVKIVKPIYAGVGYNYNFFKDFRYLIHEKPYSEFHDSFKDYGSTFALGMYIYKFNLEGYYYLGFNSNSIDHLAMDFKPTRSFGLILSYNIQLFDKFERKRSDADCPKF